MRTVDAVARVTLPHKADVAPPAVVDINVSTDTEETVGSFWQNNQTGDEYSDDAESPEKLTFAGVVAPTGV